MRTTHFLKSLLDKSLLSETAYNRLVATDAQQPMSLHWEIRILLFAGIGFLSTGLGVLVYKNIDSIGHQAIIGVIAAAIAACGWYVWKKRQPFLVSDVQKENLLADNVLLLGCTLFLVLEGYLQYQYQIFGTTFNLAALIPMVIFGICAYRFDHLGVLTMAMTAFTSWAGLVVTPLSIFQTNIFNHEKTLIQTGVVVGVVLIATGLILEMRRIKPHFTFSYLNFGYNLACIAAISGTSVSKLPYSLLALGFGVVGMGYAMRSKTAFFFLAGAIYSYIALTILLAHFVGNAIDIKGWLFYGIVSAFGLVMMFLNYRKWVSEA
jgi:Predicted membrane protein (DUF2157)